MEIRKATIDDLALVSAVEAECFPPAEAATRDSFKERLTYYGNHFWLLFEKGKLISFADGMVTNLADLTDEMYEKADMHDEHGRMADDFRAEYGSCLPEERLCGTGTPPRYP